MNVDYDTLHNAVVAAVTGHTWTLLGVTPTIYKGARLEVDQAGPIVIVEFGDESAEDRYGAGNIARYHKNIIIAAGVEYADTAQNVTDRNHLWTEIQNIVIANRSLGGLAQMTVVSVNPMRLPIAGPAAKSYRGIVYRLKGLDFHTP